MKIVLSLGLIMSAASYGMDDHKKSSTATLTGTSSTLAQSTTVLDMQGLGLKTQEKAIVAHVVSLYAKFQRLLKNREVINNELAQATELGKILDASRKLTRNKKRIIEARTKELQTLNITLGSQSKLFGSPFPPYTLAQKPSDWFKSLNPDQVAKMAEFLGVEEKVQE